VVGWSQTKMKTSVFRGKLVNVGSVHCSARKLDQFFSDNGFALEFHCPSQPLLHIRMLLILDVLYLV
jgi:hypothetical protein